MLSLEQRANLKTYRFRNGMTNLGTLIGFVKEINPRGGVIVQTQNGNHGIPFEMGPQDRVPRGLKVGSVIKMQGRMEGRRQQGTDEPTMVFRVLYFDNPRVIEMPPEEVWEKRRPAEAPDAGVKPKTGQFGIRFDHDNPRYNAMELWGYIGGISVRKAGLVRQDGSQTTGCLYLLIQQSADPQESIPVRIYGNIVNAELRNIRRGTRVKIKGASMRADVKPIGEKPTDGSLQPVNITYYVKAKTLLAVLPDDFQDGRLPEEVPAWVAELRASNDADRRQQLRKRQAAGGTNDSAAGIRGSDDGADGGQDNEAFDSNQGERSINASQDAVTTDNGVATTPEGGETVSEGSLLARLTRKPATNPASA